MKKIRFLLYAFLSISLLILVFFMIRKFRYQGKEVKLDELPLAGSDMRLDTVHFTENKEGIKEWELTAEDVQYFKDKSVMLLKGVNVRFLSGLNDTITLEGKEGHLNSDSGDIRISGDVMVTSSAGQRLYTDSLNYKSDGKMITTESKVSLSGPNITVRGKGLFMDIKNERFVILKNVYAEINSGFIDTSK
ncbi:MAG: LPS export ABC transporter periplasmic protein LptC [Thermodesulfobacteriota bacterium]